MPPMISTDPSRHGAEDGSIGGVLFFHHMLVYDRLLYMTRHDLGLSPDFWGTALRHCYASAST